MSDTKTKLIADIDRLRSKEGYLLAGLPFYPALYGRDSLISGWQLLNYDPSIARNTLIALARYQGQAVSTRSEEEPGKILHTREAESRTLWHRMLDWMQRTAQGSPYYGSIDSTPLFIVVAGEYYRATNDRDLIARLWPNIERAVRWMTDYGDMKRNGLISYRRRNPFGLRNQSWKDGISYLRMHAPVAVTEVQGYAYAAYQTAAQLARVLGKDTADWETRARLLKSKFNDAFWMDDAAFFALALDGRGKLVLEISSNPGHLLFTGILDKDRADKVVERLFKNDLLTEYGIRTQSRRSLSFRRSHLSGAIWPHDNWLIWIGLKRLAYAREADAIRDAMLKAHAELGKIPEFYDVHRNGKLFIPRRHFLGIPVGGPCDVQAWASGGLLNMLGVLR